MTKELNEIIEEIIENDDVVRLSQQVDDVNTRIDGEPILVLAMRNEAWNCVIWLLEGGADTHARESRSWDGYPGLSFYDQLNLALNEDD